MPEEAARHLWWLENTQWTSRFAWTRLWGQEIQGEENVNIGSEALKRAWIIHYSHDLENEKRSISSNPLRVRRCIWTSCCSCSQQDMEPPSSLTTSCWCFVFSPVPSNGGGYGPALLCAVMAGSTGILHWALSKLAVEIHLYGNVGTRQPLWMGSDGSYFI